MAELHLVAEYGFLGGVGGSCALCNASKRTTDRPERIVTTNLYTDAPEVDPGVWPEKYMEFCETCITEMGQMVGMISERQAGDLHDLMDSINRELYEAKQEIESLKKDLEYAVAALKFVPQAAPAPVKK